VALTKKPSNNNKHGESVLISWPCCCRFKST